MDLTPRARSLLAEPRRRLASVLAVMVLVLAVVSVHVVCSVHLDEHAHGASSAADTVAHEAAHDEAAHDEAASEPADDGSHGCADHGMVTAQSDPVRPAPQGPAAVPALAMQWLVSDMAHRAPRVSSSVTFAAAPSLHALGISRT